MNGSNASSFSRAGPASSWSGSDSLSVPDGDVGSVLDHAGDGDVHGDLKSGDDSDNIAWGVALVAAPIVVVLLLLRFRSAVESRRKPSTGVHKRHEYPTVDERGYARIGSEVERAHQLGDWQQWTRTSCDGARERRSGSSWRTTAFVRPSRSSSLEDFRHDAHQPGDPDMIWRSAAYSF